MSLIFDIVIWDGVLQMPEGQEKHISFRNELDDTARDQRWPHFFELLKKNQALINSSRLEDESLFTPLHHAAFGGASIEVIHQLLSLGAWRTLQNARGERPVDVAERRRHEHLLQVLHPVMQRHVPNGVLLKIQSHFHEVIKGRFANYLSQRRMRLPELEPLLELDEPQMMFPVPRTMGGYKYWLEETGVGAKLICESSSRVVDGSGQRHVITSEGSVLTAEGFG